MLGHKQELLKLRSKLSVKLCLINHLAALGNTYLYAKNGDIIILFSHTAYTLLEVM